MDMAVVRAGGPSPRWKSPWRRLAPVALLVIAPAVTAADAAVDARQWLDKMSRSSQRISYEGTFVYRRGEQITGMRITHIADERGARERLISLDGAPREVVREAKSVPQMLAVLEQHSPLSAPTTAALPQEANAELDKFYTFTLGGEDRTAGRITRRVNITPRDQYRYGYRVWLDETTGLLLKSELINEEGNVVEQMMFTAFRVIDKAPPVLREHPRPAEAVTPAAGVIVSADRWRVGTVPPGFNLTQYVRHNVPGTVRIFDQIVFGDGLASVSVFIEKPADANKRLLTGVSHMGPVSAFGTRVGDYHVTAVGEVPAATVQAMGNTLQPPGGGK